MKIDQQKLKEIRGGIISNGSKLECEQQLNVPLDFVGSDVNNKILCSCSGTGGNTNHAILCHCKDEACNPTK